MITSVDYQNAAARQGHVSNAGCIRIDNLRRGGVVGYLVLRVRRVW